LAWVYSCRDQGFLYPQVIIYIVFNDIIPRDPTQELSRRSGAPHFLLPFPSVFTRYSGHQTKGTNNRSHHLLWNNFYLFKINKLLLVHKRTRRRRSKKVLILWSK
jgi:hypothetical protein